MKALSKSELSELHPADAALYEEGLYDEFYKPAQRMPQPLEAADFLKGMSELANAIRNQPQPIINVAAPIVNIAAPSIEVTAKIPPTVERTRITRDPDRPNVITGSVKEVEQKQE